MKAEHYVILAFLDNGDCRELLPPKELTEEGFKAIIQSMFQNQNGVINLSSNVLDIKYTGEKYWEAGNGNK